eukprot:3669706-Amphidinium_carterae.2
MAHAATVLRLFCFRREFCSLWSYYTIPNDLDVSFMLGSNRSLVGHHVGSMNAKSSVRTLAIEP